MFCVRVHWPDMRQAGIALIPSRPWAYTMHKYIWVKRRREVVCPNLETANALVSQHGGRVKVEHGEDTPSMGNAISPVYQRAMGRHVRATGWNAVRRMEYRTGSKRAGRIISK